MKYKCKPCSIVGNAWMVVEVTKFGKETPVAIGLTKFEADCLVKRFQHKH